MEQNILFINNREQERIAFRGALVDTPFVVDLAETGEDGIHFLEQKEYGVVVCDRYKQDHVIAYIYEHCPNTFCILNAVTLNKADLQFYLNERHVYRIFLAPVDYRQDMLSVIQQAMLDYQVLKTDAGEKQKKEQQKVEKEAALQAALKVLGEQDMKWKDVERTSQYFKKRSLFYTGKNLPKERLAYVENFENMVLQHLAFFMKKRSISSDELQDMLQKRLNKNGEDRNFSVICPQDIKDAASTYFFARAWFFSWMIAYRMSLLTETYIIRTEITKLKLKEYKVSLICYLPKETWEKQKQDVAEHTISEVVLNILEAFALECVTVADDYEVIYHVMIKDE